MAVVEFIVKVLGPGGIIPEAKTINMNCATTEYNWVCRFGGRHVFGFLSTKYRYRGAILRW